MAVAAAGLGIAEAAFGESFSADPSNPSMSSSLSAMPEMVTENMMASFMAQEGSSHGSEPMLSKTQEAAVSMESSQFVEATIKAFLDKQNLPQEEMQCIQEGSGEIGGNIGKVTEQFAMILHQAFGVPVLGVPNAEGASGSSQGSSSRPSGASVNDGANSNMVDQITASQASPSPSASSLPPSSSMNAKEFGTALPPSSSQSQGGGSSSGGTDENALSFFYQNRRLQLLPGLPKEQRAGMSSMMGPQSLPMAMEIGLGMQQIVKETSDLVGKCIHSDAKFAFEQAGDHALNTKYITGHLLANGADIVSELADSVTAYEKRNATQFGTDFGKALRKVFLSNNTNGKLPEGLPGDEEIAMVTEGFLQGFFGPGSYLNVNLKKDPANPLHVDMNNCIQKDLAYFQQLWSASMLMFAQSSSGVGGSSGSRGLNSGAEKKLQLGTTLAFTMMELPGAMGKCGISSEQQDMIMDSIKGLGNGMNTQFQFPSQQPSKDEMATAFAKTLQEWSGHHWLEFGKNLGALMQKSAVKFYPQKYSIDAGGMLRQQLVAQNNGGIAVLLMIPTSLLLLAVAIAGRNRRSFATHSRINASESEDELEDGHAMFSSERGLLCVDSDAYIE